MEAIEAIISNLITNISIQSRDEEKLRGFIRYMYHNRNLDYGKHYGLWVIYEKEEQYDIFIKKLEAAFNEIAGVYPEFYKASQGILYDENQLKERLSRARTPKMLFDGYRWTVVYNIKEEGDAEYLYKAFKSTPQVVKIIGGTRETLEKRFFSNDIYGEDFRYTVLCREIHLGNLGYEDVHSRFLKKLQSKGYKTTPEFEKEILFYIETVYDGARYKDQEFIDNLIDRIEIEMLESKGVSAFKSEGALSVDVDFIPYSFKVKNRREEIDKEVLNEQKKQDASENINEIIEVKIEKKPIKKIEKETDEKNVILCAMSTFNQNLSVNYYYSQFGEKYFLASGISQLEPGTKYYINKFAARGEKIDRIIIYCTNESKNIVEKELPFTKEKINQSPVDFYQDRILDYVKDESHEDNNLAHISECYSLSKVKNDDIKKDIESVMMNSFYYSLNGLYDSVKKESFFSEVDETRDPIDALVKLKSVLLEGQYQKINVYVDAQGGSRAFMNMVSNLLTIQQETPIQVKQVIVSKFTNGRCLHPIEDETNSYKVGEFVSATQAFTKYGRADLFKDYYNKKMYHTNSASKSEKEFVDAMGEIADAISISDPAGFEDALKKLTEKIKNIEAGSSIDSYFKYVFEDIKNSYGNLLENHTVIHTIKWCIDNKYTQQALSLIEDKMPVYMMQHLKSLGKVFSGMKLYKGNEENSFLLTEKNRIKDVEKAFNDTKSFVAKENKWFYSGYNELKKAEDSEYKKSCINRMFYIIKHKKNSSELFRKLANSIQIKNSEIGKSVIKKMKFVFLIDTLKDNNKKEIDLYKQITIPCPLQQIETIEGNEEILLNYVKEDRTSSLGILCYALLEFIDKTKELPYLDEKFFIKKNKYKENLSALAGSELKNVWMNIDSKIQCLCLQETILNHIGDEKWKDVFALLLQISIDKDLNEIYKNLFYDEEKVKDKYEELVDKKDEDAESFWKLYCDYKEISNDFENHRVLKYFDIRIFASIEEELFGENEKPIRHFAQYPSWAAVLNGGEQKYQINGNYTAIIPEIDLDESYRKELDQFLKLHNALKKERNSSNHASERGLRVPFSMIEKILYMYVEKAEHLSGKISNVAENRIELKIDKEIPDSLNQEKVRELGETLYAVFVNGTFKFGKWYSYEEIIKMLSLPSKSELNNGTGNKMTAWKILGNFYQKYFELENVGLNNQRIMAKKI